MAISVQGEGSQTATINTPHTLLDVAVAGVFEFEVDLDAMQDGDVLWLRVYKIVRTGGTRHLVMEEMVCDDRSDVIYFDPVTNDLTDAGSLRFELLQTVPTGGGRAYPWKVIKTA